MTVRHVRRQIAAGAPAADLALANEHPVLGLAVVLVEEQHGDRVHAIGSRKAVARGARVRARTGGGPTARRRLPRRDRLHDVAVQRHRFRFDSTRRVSGPSPRIGNARRAEEPADDRVAPHNRVAALIFEFLEHGRVAIRVDRAREFPPAVHELRGLFRALVVCVVNMLNDRAARLQPVRVRHVVHEQQQVVGAGLERFVRRCHLRRVLRDVLRAGRHRPIHADALVVGTMPLSPPVALRRLDAGTVVRVEDVGERSRAERTGITLVRRPRFQQDAGDRFDHAAIVAECEPRPFVRNARRRQIGIPCQPAEPVQVRDGQIVTKPVARPSDIRHADEAAERARARRAGRQRFHRRGAAAGAHVEVEHFFPHRDEKADVALLAGVLLRDLQLDRLVRSRERPEQRRSGLADLEVNGAMFDLQDDVVVEPAVEIVEIVPGGAGAIVFRIAPVHMVVVDEAAIEQHTAVRCQRARDDVRRIRVCPAVRRRPEPPFGIGFEDEPGKIGNRAVQVGGPIAPEGRHARVERIERVESADTLWTAEVDGDREANAPRPERVREPREIRHERRGQHAGIGIDIVHRARVHADRRQQPRVGAGARQIVHHVAGFKEDGASAVTSLDRAVQIVPFVHPPQRRGRRFHFAHAGKRLVQGHAAEQRKRPVQSAAVAAARDHDQTTVPIRERRDPEPVESGRLRHIERRNGLANPFGRPEDERVARTKGAGNHRRPVQHRSEPTGQLVARCLQEDRASQRDNSARNGVVLTANRGIGDERISKPPVAARFRRRRSRDEDHHSHECESPSSSNHGHLDDRPAGRCPPTPIAPRTPRPHTVSECRWW